ncbi:MAG: hypothetical protein ABIH59_01865 [archaeon]
MKMYMLISVIVGLLVFGAIVIIANSKTIQANVENNKESCTYETPGCPYSSQGGCTQESNCGLDACAVKYGGSCGCRK